MHTIKCVETKRTNLDLPKDIEYDIVVRWTNKIGPQERVDHYKVPAQAFSVKVEGKRYVDGEFTTDYVQYL